MRAAKWFLLIVAVAALVGAAKFWTRRPHRQPLRTFTVSRGDVIAILTEKGTVKPAREEEVRPPLGLAVKRWLVESGDPVRRGQPLAELDTSELRDQVGAFRAQLAAAKAAGTSTRLMMPQPSYPPSELAQELRAIRELLAQGRSTPSSAPGPASVTLPSASVPATGSGPQSTPPAAPQAVPLPPEQLPPSDPPPSTPGDTPRAAEQALSEIERAVQSGAYSPFASPERYQEVNAAGVAELERALRAAERRLREARMVSPIDGVLLDRGDARAQSKVPALTGASSAAVVADVSNMVVQVQVSEVDITQVKKGQAATVDIEALHGPKFQGTVTKVSRVPGKQPPTLTEREAPVTFPVEVSLSALSPDLRPGMSALVHITVGERRGVLTVPLEAVEEGDEGPTCLVVEESKQVKRKVTTGLSDDQVVEIVSGLQEGEKVTAIPSKVPRKVMEFGPRQEEE